MKRSGIRRRARVRGRLRPVVAVAAAAGLLSVLPTLGGAAAVADAGHKGAAKSGDQTASARAAASGQRVEVTGDRTEFATTYANPDGYTYTQEQSSVPVRVRTRSGGWTAPDATLQVRADGTVGPKAAMVDLAFSGGGSAPMVSLGSAGRTVALTWPGTLPKPVLDGDSAVYPDVMPGVDLRLTASVQGYRELLVVKTPAAAADPALKKITFGVHASGLRVGRLAGGGLSGVDADGKQIFTAPPAQMWDSRGTGPAAQAQAKVQSGSGSGVQPKAGVQAAPDQAATAPPASAVDGPAPGAGAAAVPVTVAGDALSLAPGASLLKQTDTAAYPLYIDPNIALSSGAPERTLLRSDGYSDYAWANGTNGEGDGKCGTWNGYYCGPNYVQKLYFQFTPGNLKGKQVLSATFRVTSPWAFQCSARQTDLVRTNNISSATTWASRPKELDWMVDESFSAGRGSSCDPDSPDAPIEFKDNPSESDENLTPTVRDFAAGKFAKLTLELRAHDESDTSAWKRFKNDATLTVNYVGLPVPPTYAGIQEGSGISCEPSASDPDVVADPHPQLTARPQVASGGTSAGAPAKLRVDFLMQQQYSSGTWGMITEPIRPMAPDFAGANSTVSTPTPITLSEGPLYRLAASTWSYEDNQSTHINSHSTVTTHGWCYFRVDTTAPKAPSVAFGGPYTSCTTNDCQAAGGPGQAGTFTFAAASGDKVAGFQYKLASGAWSSTISGAGPVTVKITPQLTGTQQLQVRAKDDVGSGRWGAKTIVTFKVAEGADAVSRWHFTDSAPGSGGTSAADSATETGSRHPATLHNAGAGWSSLGRRGAGDNSLWLNDTTAAGQQTGYADTSGPVVNTQDSFTVASWVRLADTTAYHTILSQTSSDKSSFTLRYSPGIHRWVFLWTWPQSGAVSWLGANGTTDVVPDVWTHVAATYDKPANAVTLFVNGVQQGAPVVLPAAAKATASDGPLQIGRYNDPNKAAYTEYWKGRIDEAEVWQRALTPDEIALDARLLDADGKPAVENVAQWQPDPAAASTTGLDDTGSGYAHTLTFSNGATLADGAIVLDGANDAAATPGPMVDETGSFTVTSQVQIDQDAILAKPDGYAGQVAGQRSADGSAWGLWYQITGRTTILDDDLNQVTVPTSRWLFGRLNADGTFSGAASEVQVGADTGDGSNGEGAVRVTGVFDAQDGTASLYMGVAPEDTQPYTAVVGADRFSVGDAFVAGAWSHYLPARVQDLRVWSGATSDPDQLGQVIGD
ncbi:laminin G domain-containing protein [Actinacidiphila bryophytorum]|uniref:LamG domain-containing protein n=1 Tax=Actinacidiphila bryophytorum TaxID=1436133 RepID=UPI002176A47F|nr:LamG domain-containing protein [Actinacidiphila bryophytorum]UWE12676.1 LamG domain-containing protein [Actinacidiphila bryophytorum]